MVPMGKRYAIPVLLWGLAAGSFLVLGSLLIMSASGYGFNLQSGRFQKTSFLRIRSVPREVTLLLQGKLVAQRTPWERKRLFPGSYEIKIEKPGYHTWSKIITIEPSQALVLDEVVLFKQAAPEPASAEEATLVEKGAEPDDLYFQGGEIFSVEQVITRLSRDVLAVAWHPGKHFVAYQIDTEIRVVELDGSNDFKLADLETKKPTKFSFTNDGERFLYQDGKSTKKLVLI